MADTTAQKQNTAAKPPAKAAAGTPVDTAALEGLSGVQKAAILLITLGPERSAEIFKHLKLPVSGYC